VPAAPTTELSTVVHISHSGVWSGDTLVSDAIGQMLDTAIASLTGLDDARVAWASLFHPSERIAIKVNTIRGSSYWTHVPLVLGVTDRLRAVGIAPEQIVIFDRNSGELGSAGYAVNKDGPGVRCQGTDSGYSNGWTIMDQDVGLSNILLNCDALINMPILKQHGIAGISFALKNHYGTFNKPGSFHGERIARGMAELNTLPPIKDRTRLIIGDALAIVKSGWHTATVGNSILMGFDPVAHDTVGLQLYRNAMTAEGINTERAAQRANGWLTNSAQLNLGTDDLDEIGLMEMNLE
jgi:uncharacterized protein (DUF362 family)